MIYRYSARLVERGLSRPTPAIPNKITQPLKSHNPYYYVPNMHFMFLTETLPSYPNNYQLTTSDSWRDVGGCCNDAINLSSGDDKFRFVYKAPGDANSINNKPGLYNNWDKDAYFVVPDTDSLTVRDNNMSLFAVVDFVASEQSRLVVSKFGEPNNRMFQMKNDSTSQWSFIKVPNGNWPYVTATGNASMGTVAAVFSVVDDGSSIKLYRNNAQDNVTEKASSTAYFNGVGPLFIGSLSTSLTLSAADIEANQAGTSPMYGSIGAVMMCGGLDDQRRNKVTKWLGDKFGISVTR